VQLLIHKILFILENAVFLAVLLVSFIYRKNRELNPIRFYLAESLFNILMFFVIPHNGHGRGIYDISNNLFSFLDLTVLYYYFWSLTKSSTFSRILFGTYATISVLSLYFWISPRYGISTFMPILYGLQSLFITIPCLLYIYELFQSDEETGLKTNPHFYVACAFLFFYGATFPFYMSYETLYAVTPEIVMALSSIQSILVVIMYFTIIKAFLCPYPERKY
jgi:hypothetical protein